MEHGNGRQITSLDELKRYAAAGGLDGLGLKNEDTESARGDVLKIGDEHGTQVVISRAELAQASVRHQQSCEHFRLLSALVSALALSGAMVVDADGAGVVDPDFIGGEPEGCSSRTYRVMLSCTSNRLATQVLLLQTLLVTGAVVRARYCGQGGYREEEIVRIGWPDPGDVSGTMRLVSLDVVFLVQI